MRNTAEHIENLYFKVRDYAETSIELYRLQAIDATGSIISNLVTRTLFILVLATFLFFFNLSLGFFIGKLLDSYYLGFLIVSTFYLLIGVVLYIMRHKWIKNPINDLVLSKLETLGAPINSPKKIENNESL